MIPKAPSVPAMERRLAMKDRPKPSLDRVRERSQATRDAIKWFRESTGKKVPKQKSLRPPRPRREVTGNV